MKINHNLGKNLSKGPKKVNFFFSLRLLNYCAGSVITFLTLDCKIANELKELLELSDCDIPLQGIRQCLDRKLSAIHTEMGDSVA